MATSSTPSPSSSFAPLVATIDVATVILASMVAHWMRFGAADMSAKFEVLTGGTALLLVFCLTITGVYNSWRGRRLLTLLKRYTLSLLLTTAVLLAFLVFTKTAIEFSRLWLAYLITITWCGSILYRCGHHLCLKHLRSSGKNLRSVLIVTSDKHHAEMLFDTQEMQLSGYQLVHYVHTSEVEDWIRSDQMIAELGKYSIDEVWLDLPLSMGGFIKDVVYGLRHATVDIRFFPDFDGIQLLNHKVSSILGHYAIDISCTPMSGFNRSLKRFEDLLLSTLICILITPPCLVIALLIKISSPGPVLFKQYRNGRDGKRFKVYKFRSMDVHQETDGTVTQATPNDPRVSRIGNFLRRSSLDELPQFFNVVQGRMSIVGPRPHALAHNEYYMDLIESYMWRHKVKPGITGLAQIRGYRGLTDTLEKMERRVECDLEYINNWSLWLDLKIIILTVFSLFHNKNAF
ncbi:undecaprenyl-phosphate glucose phosphotransferase [Porticoccus sp.]|uniref:undecaprenyl-phosphate glucose phosphotransferase n=1 Tax=Porticoccus sp. TaxID=2024853 RepID=UPI003F69D756